jgi:hypothetical protein
LGSPEDPQTLSRIRGKILRKKSKIDARPTKPGEKKYNGHNKRLSGFWLGVNGMLFAPISPKSDGFLFRLWLKILNSVDFLAVEKNAKSN